MQATTFLTTGTLRGVPKDAPNNAPLSMIGRCATDGSLGSPVALLKRSALANNSRWMHRFAAHYGVQLAPHGKTSMAPKIFEMQLRDGSRWLSLANVTQAQVARTAGAKHILISNQVVNLHDLEYLARETSSGEFEAMCYVDSVEGVRLLETAIDRHPRKTPFPVLIEIGVIGGRAGVRGVEQAQEVARVVNQCPSLVLAGLAGYEGVYSPKDSECISKVDGYLHSVVEIARKLAAEERFTGDQIVLTAGGSKFFDRVAEIFSTADLGKPVDVILRCGCYLFHDAGIYEEAMQMLYERNDFARSLGRLMPAIEIWGQVQSRPESVRAIVDIGRRESSYDAGLPIPYLWSRPADSQAIRKLAGSTTAKLNDQHCFLDLEEESPLQIGDLVGFAVSHPCTVFDKWHGMYLVEDDYTVADFVETFFG